MALNKRLDTVLRWSAGVVTAATIAVMGSAPAKADVDLHVIFDWPVGVLLAPDHYRYRAPIRDHYRYYAPRPHQYRVREDWRDGRRYHRHRRDEWRGRHGRGRHHDGHGRFRHPGDRGR
ncbi:MAG: hypothetical protein KDC18_05555 [Alphaproteobacteria bacterium]|nr:hypothetical protein [Alphaproteobacteria bacterium]MCB9927965.1 hypothetical protein [Alphaproteobacteria bacterium]